MSGVNMKMFQLMSAPHGLFGERNTPTLFDGYNMSDYKRIVMTN